MEGLLFRGGGSRGWVGGSNPGLCLVILGGGGGVKLALLGSWLTHQPTLRSTHPPAAYPEGGVTEQFWMKQIQVDHSIAGAANVHNRV